MSEFGVNLVQEVAKADHGLPPHRYLVREEERPNGDDAPLASDIPIIDLSRLSRCHDDEAKNLRSALHSWGLFQVVGHDMPAAFLDEVRDVAKKFFQLPMEIKQKYSVLKEGMTFKAEGYGIDTAATEDQILNWNDRLFLLVQPENERRLDRWPENPISFRDVLNEYTTGARKVVNQVLYSMAKLLKLDENYFIHQLGESAEVHARFNYYPSCSRPDLVFGVKPHSDGSVVTIILLDSEVEGLQVLKDCQWVKVPIIPHALLVNLGNEMEIMCNGIFKAPIHRVVANQGERISLAMFYQLEREKYLEPAPGLVDEARPRLYNQVSVKDFRDVHFLNTSIGKSATDWLKI